MISYKETLKNQLLTGYMTGFNFLNYYKDYKLQYYFIKYLKDREFCFLPSRIDGTDDMMRRRNIRAHNIQSIQYWLNEWNLFKRDRLVNLYYSMAKYRNGIPRLYERGALIKKDGAEWNESSVNEITEYDCLIDVDAGTHAEMAYAKESAENVQLQLDILNIPYYLRFSGCGFHFIIPSYVFEGYSYLPSENNNVYKRMREFVKHIYDNVSEMIDLTVYDARRVVKLPMSISIYDNDAFVCTPIHDLKNFNYHDVSITKFKYSSPIEDRLYNENSNVRL